ncbi:MAG: hypothetical protein A2W93_00290 [Bacteroidetes bacterium GWF2_43_63]|nr:MAG: hypothetical protein A2W94_13230 [Bacteroidetes bacterium GWE2_42_42]OFY53844.1 MAG: hypothetical protein A2W93_00290 [Bacteroidetes bacterium GWF2_43_63]HBG69802.1 hypothetical protein [Bacteroidales bacterium]HCB61000.1 hypothetical protein [Bacteroidales bacterium]HCY24556.1 hypothetical protein [Bacteroidales bacterium]
MRTIRTILIAEPSIIIFEGLAQILLRTETAVHIKHIQQFNDLDLFLGADPEAVVIINPAMVQFNQKDFQALKIQRYNVRWMALATAFYDQQLMTLFDGIIGINDSPGAILQSVRKLFSADIQLKQTAETALSERETDVLKLLAVGMSNKEIADKLNISINTVISHRKNLTQKTGIKTVSGLTIYAVVNKLISIDSL